MIQTHQYIASAKGPRLLFFGALHGTETCGSKAIERVMSEVRSGKIKILKGSVMFVPVCNPLAYARKVRYVEENLNRVFMPTRKPSSYEAQLANILCSLVDDCDVLLDIHSTTAKGRPFIYLDFPTTRNRRSAAMLGPKEAVVGWPELYKKWGGAHVSFDTATYAASQKKDSLTIECGQHDDPASILVAYRAVCNTLKHYGLVAGEPRSRKLTLAKIEYGFFREKGESLANPSWRHFDRVVKNTPLIIKGSGVIVAPHDGYIIMPKHSAPIGQDWLYFGRDVD